MEEIKVGEYVRDKYGEIHIVYKVEKDTVYCDKPKMEKPPFDTYGCRYYDNRADILKHSYNIIDLIEVGDYVNGELIDFISISIEGNKRPLIRDNIYFFDKYIDITSIVTKEMFEEIKYEVK